MFSIDIQKRVGTFDLQPAFEAANELVVLFGPSGCGKSLTLQAVAGLLTPERGRITLPDGRVAFDHDAGIVMPPQVRNVGYVVQNLALFPHMTARHNIEFALNRLPKVARRVRVDHLLALLSLSGLENRRPSELSGGQQQRVALARALAPEPSLLLLDEPFSALDAALRSILRRELKTLQRGLGVTTLFVTHDITEAHSLADRIVVYDDGRVLQQGAQADVMRRPASRRVAELTDVRNIIPGTVIAYVEGVAVVRTAWFEARIADANAPRNGNVFICIRPEHVLLLLEDREPHNRGDAVIEAEITDDVPLGNTHRLFMRTQAAGDTGAPLLLEVDVPAHPYDRLGVAGRKAWRVVLTAENMSLAPRD